MILLALSQQCLRLQWAHHHSNGVLIGNKLSSKSPATIQTIKMDMHSNTFSQNISSNVIMDERLRYSLRQCWISYSIPSATNSRDSKRPTISGKLQNLRSSHFFNAFPQLQFIGEMPMGMLLEMYKSSSMHDMFDFCHGLLVLRIYLPLNTYGIISVGDLIVLFVEHIVRLNYMASDRGHRVIPQRDIQNFYDAMPRCVRALMAARSIGS